MKELADQMRSNKFHLTVIIILSTLCSGCKNSSVEPTETDSFEVAYSSIANQDTVEFGAGLIFQFSKPIALESLLADTIVSSTNFATDGGGEMSLPLTVLQVKSSKNVLLNNVPQTLWYDPNSATLAFVEHTTIFQPEGTGEGLRLSGNNLIEIASTVESNDGDVLGEKFEMAFSANERISIKALPNPLFPVLSTHPSQTMREIVFIHLPATCELRIATLSGQAIKTIERSNASDGFERWNLKNQSNQDIKPGIYRYEVQSSELTFTNGVLVIN